MTSESERAKALFQEAIENIPKTKWEDFLEEHCPDNYVRQRVRDLLSAHEGMDSLLDRQPATAPLSISESPGDTIGQYKLLQNIGEGGFGVVFMAEQAQPIRRTVAIKVIKPGMDTKEVIARFEAERQALAIMNHPNIAKVFDGGATESGRPYFVMELVKGVTLTKYADENQLSTEDRLALFSQICRAVHHAHQKGIIHRDLKPSNVLVTLHDGVPVPKIIDFGVSKAISQPLTERTMFTQYGQVIGTPQYMSPEQAEMSGLDIDTRSDVYSLGVMLYELLTGQTPFTSEEIRRAGLNEMRRLIREQEPVRPSNILETFDKATATAIASHRASRPEQLRRSLRGELDWIVLKSLEKDRNRRYDTAISFANDVENHLNNEPVSANPPTFTYQCSKFYKRYRGACRVALVIGALLVATTMISTTFWMKAESARQRMELAMREKVEAAQIAQDAAVAEHAAKASAQSTLSLLIRMLSKAGTNPETNQEFTVSEALSSLATVSQEASPKQGSEESEVGPFPATVLAELHRALGKAYVKAGRHQLALEHLEIARERCREVLGNNSPQLAECLRFIGEVKQSPTTMLEAIEIYQGLGLRSKTLETRTSLGKMCLKNNELLLAEEQLQIACEEYKEISPQFIVANLPHLVLSRVYRQKDDIALETDWFHRALRIAINAYGEDTEEWFRIATSFYENRQYRDSEFAFRVVLHLNDENDRNIQELALFRLSVSCRKIGELDLAIQFMTETYESTSAAGSAWAADRARALGGLYNVKGDFARAAALFADAVRWELKKSTNTDDFETSQLLLVAERSPEAKTTAYEFAQELIRLEPDDEINDMNLASTLGFMRLAGYDVGTGQEQILGNRLLTHFESLAGLGEFDAALEFSTKWVPYLLQKGNKERAAWQQARCTRLLYQCLDFPEAVKSHRKAIELAADPTQREWLNYELAMILHFNGQQKEAKALAAQTFREVHQLNIAGSYIAHKLADRFCLAQLAIIAEQKEDGARKFLESMQWINTDELGKFALRCMNLALGMAHEDIGDHLQAIDAYEVAMKMEYEFPSYPQYHFDDRLIELLDQTNQSDRGIEVFTSVLETRLTDLPDRHPVIGLTKLRLADVMIRGGKEVGRAKELLAQSRETMKMHRITPERIFDRIDRLAEQASTQ